MIMPDRIDDLVEFVAVLDPLVVTFDERAHLLIALPVERAIWCAVLSVAGKHDRQPFRKEGGIIRFRVISFQNVMDGLIQLIDACSPEELLAQLCAVFETAVLDQSGNDF